MTFSVPSFLAAATSAVMPPAALRELAVDTFLPLELLVVLPELPPLLHPAANTRVPTAAVATTANFPRKTSLPDLFGRSTSWLDKLAWEWLFNGGLAAGRWPLCGQKV